MTTSPPTPPSDLDLHRLAEQFMDALLDSADVRRIGVARWWERAKTALETGAAASTSWRECVARAGKKMEIETYSGPSSEAITGIAGVLDDPDVFARWRTIATRDALTITAMVRHARTTRRAAQTVEETPA